MTIAMEEYVRAEINAIIRDSASPDEVWATVEDKFEDLGISILQDMNYPEVD